MKASVLLHNELTPFMTKVVVTTDFLEEYIIDAMIKYSEQNNDEMRGKWNNSILRNQKLLEENDSLWNLLHKFSEAYYNYGIGIPDMNVLVDEIEAIERADNNTGGEGIKT